jgi:hypothetical protein
VWNNVNLRVVCVAVHEHGDMYDGLRHGTFKSAASSHRIYLLDGQVGRWMPFISHSNTR